LRADSLQRPGEKRGSLSSRPGGLEGVYPVGTERLDGSPPPAAISVTRGGTGTAPGQGGGDPPAQKKNGGKNSAGWAKAKPLRGVFLLAGFFGLLWGGGGPAGAGARRPGKNPGSRFEGGAVFRPGPRQDGAVRFDGGGGNCFFYKGKDRKNESGGETSGVHFCPTRGAYRAFPAFVGGGPLFPKKKGRL